MFSESVDGEIGPVFLAATGYLLLIFAATLQLKILKNNPHE